MVNNRKILSKRKKRNRKISSKRGKRKRVLSRMRRFRKQSQKIGGDKPEKEIVTSMTGELRSKMGDKPSVSECHRHSPGCVKSKKHIGWDIDLWDCDPNRKPGDPNADCQSPGLDPNDPSGPSKLFDIKGKKVSRWSPIKEERTLAETETPYCCPYQASEILTEKGGFCRAHPCDTYLPL